MTEKKKILLIDDEDDFCFFVKNNLERTGEFEVTTTTRGAEGINIARKEKPDLILLDIVMPEISGNEVAGILSSDPLTRKIPLVFLTAVVAEEEVDAESPKIIGGQNFIAKALGTEKIINSIKRVLEQDFLRQKKRDINSDEYDL